jgi:hypothetical protein
MRTSGRLPNRISNQTLTIGTSVHGNVAYRLPSSRLPLRTAPTRGVGEQNAAPLSPPWAGSAPFDGLWAPGYLSAVRTPYRGSCVGGDQRQARPPGHRPPSSLTVGRLGLDRCRYGSGFCAICGFWIAVRLWKCTYGFQDRIGSHLLVNPHWYAELGNGECHTDPGSDSSTVTGRAVASGSCHLYRD